MKKIIATAVLSAAFAAPAFADTPFYALVEYNSPSVTNNSSNSSNPWTLSTPSDFRIGGGYQITPILGVELGYSIIGNQTASTGANAVNGTITVKSSSYQVAAVGTYPINESFDLIGKLGVASNSASWDYAPNTVSANNTALSGSGSATSVMYAIAGQYNINKQIAVRLGYTNLGSMGKMSGGVPLDASVISEVSLGAVYKF